MGRLISALLGAFGFVKYQKKWKAKATWEKFIKSCQKAKRPNEYLVSFILTLDVTPEFLSGGISGATASGWQHVFTCLWDQGDLISYDEIIESLALVEAKSLSRYKRDDIQAVAFSLSLNKHNFDKLKKQLYDTLNKPYDVGEFIKYIGGIFEVFPNSRDFFVCSTQVLAGAKDVYHRWFGRYKKIRLLKKGKNPEECLPVDIWNGCYPQFKFRVSRYHC